MRTQNGNALTLTYRATIQPRKAFVRVALLASAACAITSVEAQAQAAGAPESVRLEEIVVTAQKRSQQLQEVPLSVSAYTATALEQAHIVNVIDVASIEPGLQLNNNAQRLEVTIRGIGKGSPTGAFEQPVATYINGFYQARGSAASGDFFDVERVEVLKGPQGTLYGRNATGGAINIIYKRPSNEMSAEVLAEGIYVDSSGNQGTGYAAGAIVNLPLSSQISTRFSVYRKDRDGYNKIIDENGDSRDGLNERSIAFRGQILFEPSENFSALISGDYLYEKDRSGYNSIYGTARPDFELTGVTLGGDNCGRCRITYADFPLRTRIENYGLTADLNWEIGDGFSMKSLTQWRRLDYFGSGDFDGTQIPLGNIDIPQDSRQFTQEFQLNYDSDKLKVIAGLFYFRERIDVGVVAPFPIFGADAYVRLSGKVKTDAYAAFTDVTYNITDKFAIILGARYSREVKGGDQNVLTDFPELGLFIPNITSLPNVKYNSFTPKISVTYKPNEDILLYASYTKGFKSGGYNIGNFQNTPFDPENVKAFEAGVKIDAFSNRLQFSAAGFYYDYSNLQLEDTVDTAVITRNAAGARIYGLEAQATALITDAWRVTVGGTLLNPKFNEGVLTNQLYPERGPESLVGRELPRAPRSSGTITTDYTVRLGSGATLVPSFTAAYKGHQWHTAFNDPGVDQKAYWLLRAAITYTDPNDRWSLSLYGDNLTNKFVLTGMFPGSVAFGYQNQGTANTPRVFGLRLRGRL